MAADLRERVARAIARDENGDETGWQAWRNAADAVLAELGPELAPQGEAVGVVQRSKSTAGYADEMQTALFFKVLPAGARLYAAPQPQAEPVGEVYSSWSTGREEYVGVRAELTDAGDKLPVGTKLYAAPQPQEAADAVTREAAVLVGYMDHAAFDSSKIPAGMAASLRRLREKLAAPQPQPQPQASAEDVELVGLAVKEHAARYPGSVTEAAFERIRASMGVK